MARDLESLRSTLWTQFEKVAADSALGWGEDFQKANALAIFSMPLAISKPKLALRTFARGSVVTV